MYCTYTPLSSVTAPPTFSDSSASAATFSELMTFEVKLSIQFAVIRYIGLWQAVPYPRYSPPAESESEAVYRLAAVEPGLCFTPPPAQPGDTWDMEPH